MNEIFECFICLEEFDEEVREPKIFPCGHSICNYCVYKIEYKNNIIACPVCRKRYRVKNLEDLTKNYLAEQLISEYKK